MRIDSTGNTMRWDLDLSLSPFSISSSSLYLPNPTLLRSKDKTQRPLDYPLSIALQLWTSRHRPYDPVSSQANPFISPIFYNLHR
jgi:hypothetical protein